MSVTSRSMAAGSGLVFALAAGCCAAAASTCAKLAMSPDILKNFSCIFVKESCSVVVVTARIASFMLVFLFNALMWTLFVKSLRHCSSSAEATVTNTGSNFICTAGLSWLVFGESVSLRWWFGTSLILSGLVLIHHGNLTRPYEHTQSKPDIKVD